MICVAFHENALSRADMLNEHGQMESRWLTTATLERAQELCAEEKVSDVVWVNGQMHASCAYAFGDKELREQNRMERLQRILRVRALGRTTDIVYQDSKLRTPLVRTLEGIRMEDVEEASILHFSCADIEGEIPGNVDVIDLAEIEKKLGAPEIETVAWAYLGDPFADLCTPGVFPLQRDDALGAEGQVIHLGHMGALAMYRGDLLWVPFDNEAPPPSIRMIWRSDFQVTYESRAGKSNKASSQKKRGQKKRSRR